jgi:hypothetical protein
MIENEPMIDNGAEMVTNVDGRWGGAIFTTIRSSVEKFNIGVESLRLERYRNQA